MIKCVIDRKKWYRGHGSKSSRLLRLDGTMCCMGFLAMELGAKKSDIMNISSFADCEGKLKGYDEDYGGILVDLYETNDSRVRDEATREQNIKEHGKKIGVNFTFKN